MPLLLPAETIRAKRDGAALSGEQIADFARGLAQGANGHWSDSQAAALAMAIFLKGMGRDECVALTRAMRDSGEVLRWPDANGPVLDKHSTGGVGDKVSLALAPIVAACGGVVPMISGRGLGHSGGTLDKLEALPGYACEPPRATLLAVLRDCGCAIVGAGPELAPADKRLYAIRDVTATVESIPLITASILAKKLAAGLQGLVLDVKVGNGAFMDNTQKARALARNLVDVAAGAGLQAEALLTDMNQVLGRTAGNALELREAIDLLTDPDRAEPRLRELTLELAARMLRLGGLAPNLVAARTAAEAALTSGQAAERFAHMVAGLGGPRDVLTRLTWDAAPVQRDVPAPRGGVLTAMDTRALGLAVVQLGGGRHKPGDRIDARVGFSHILPLGSVLRGGDALLRVHAASDDDAQQALYNVLAAITIGDAALDVPPLIHGAVPQ